MVLVPLKYSYLNITDPNPVRHLMNKGQVDELWHTWCSDLIIVDFFTSAKTLNPSPAEQRLWNYSWDSGSSQMSYSCFNLGLCLLWSVQHQFRVYSVHIQST